MTMPAFFSKKSQSHRRFSQAGTTDEDAKKISIEDLYDILGSPNLESLKDENKDMHPPISSLQQDTPELLKEMYSYKTVIDENGSYVYNQDSHITRIKAKAHACGLEMGKHIFIETNPGKIYIDETSSVYHTKYKITIKNLVIKLGTSLFPMFFDKIGNPHPEYHPPESKLITDIYNGGTYLVFENNHFVSSVSHLNNFNPDFQFVLGEDMYLIFRDNKFDAMSILLVAKENAIVELTGNDIENSNVTIMGETKVLNDYERGYRPLGMQRFSSRKIMAARRMEEFVNLDKVKIGDISAEGFIADIEEKIINNSYDFSAKDILKMLIYMDKKVRINPNDIKLTEIEAFVRLADNAIVKLRIENIICCFRGSNTINNLEMSKDINYLYWGPYQNIDPEGKNAYNHKQMFINFIERAAKNNDKMQEARLRRELMKCEKALLRDEKRRHSWQDKVILWWSSFVSDYGTSWLRPVLGLFIMNASLAGVIAFCHNFSWWILFAEFFNPLSHLSDTLNLKESNGLISSINIAQKAILALCLYEMIKIFRRFSK